MKAKQKRQRYPVDVFGQNSKRNYMICKLHIIERETFNQLARKYDLTHQRINNIIRRYEDKFLKIYHEGKE